MAPCPNASREREILARFNRQNWHFSQKLIVLASAAATLILLTLLVVGLGLVPWPTLIGASGVAAALIWHGEQT